MSEMIDSDVYGQEIHHVEAGHEGLGAHAVEGCGQIESSVHSRCTLVSLKNA